MKTQLILSLILCSALYISCNSKTEDTSTETAIDTAGMADSVRLSKLKVEDQNKVIGNITFNLDERSYKKAEKAFLKISHPNEYGTEFKIGDYVFTIMDPLFYKEKLYSVNIQGSRIHYDDYNSSLLKQVEILKTMLVKKYGEPTDGSGAPAWHETDKGYTYLAYSWVIGAKTIQIRVSNKEIYFTTDLHIFQPAIAEEVSNQNSIRESSVADKAKDVL
jgi:hypothetical protein